MAQNNLKLRGRTALVTGANRGIGFEVCRQLGKQGARVILATRSLEKGKQATAQLQKEGIDAVSLQLDVSDSNSVESTASTIAEEVDILVNNAAILDRGNLMTLNYSLLNDVIQTNLIGPVVLATRIAKGMRKRNWGRIVNVTSGMGAISNGLGTDSVAYRLSKLAMNGFTVCLAQELRGTNVLVNSVDPGWVRTQMGGPHANKTIEEGASSIVSAVLFPDSGETGAFFRNGRRVDW